MAPIVLFSDTDAGHLLASLGLARALERRGHNVVLIGMAQIQEAVTQQGFRFRKALPDLLPAISRGHFGANLKPTAQRIYFGPLVRGEILDECFADLRPSLVLINSLLSLEALVIRYRYRVPVALITTGLPRGTREERVRGLVNEALQLRDGLNELIMTIRGVGLSISSVRELADLVLELPEMVCQDRNFDPQSVNGQRNLYYIGPALDPERDEPEFDWSPFDPSRPVVFCALGSQCYLRPNTSRRFFERVIEAFLHRVEWQLILSTGGRLKLPVEPSRGSNVHLYDWAPQVTVLRRAAAAIVHAGMGTVRECIDACVPMIAYPWAHDQFDVAELLAHHKIGVVGSISTDSAADITARVAQVISEAGFRLKIAQLRESASRSGDLHHAIHLLEDCMSACQAY